MILNGLGLNVSTNTVYRKTGAKANEYVSVSQMMNAAASYGIDSDYFYPWNLDDLMRSIMSGRAFIPLVHYGEWSKLGLTQSSFTGPHFVVVVGFDERYIYVNDPLWKDSRRTKASIRPGLMISSPLPGEMRIKMATATFQEFFAPMPCQQFRLALVSTLLLFPRT